MWRSIEASGAPVRYRKVKKSELGIVEKKLGVALPPSYVELVLELGAPSLGPNSPIASEKVVENLPFAVLRPSEIVRFTLELRESVEPEGLEDPDSFDRVCELLKRAVWFQFGGDAGEGYVFLTDTVNEAGEMRVGDYAHDYLEELDWSAQGAVFKSLYESTEDVARRIAAHQEALAEALGSRKPRRA